MGILILTVVLTCLSIPLLAILYLMASWYELGLDRATAQSLVPRKLDTTERAA